MSMIRTLTGGMMALTLMLTAGCSWFSNDIPADNTEPLPPAYGDPLAGNHMGLTDGGAWGEGSNEGSLGDPAAGEWTPVDPEGNLGFPIIYFAYDTDELVPSETAKLDRVNDYLAQQSDLGLIIEGHCDQRGTEEYNRALGDRRANAIRAYLTGLGLSDARIKTISYGEDHPAVEGSGEAAWSKNRRGVLVPARMN